MSPRLTRRGKAVAVVAVVGAVMGWGYGGRNLNMVVMPAVGLLAVSALSLYRVEKPRVERHAPNNGFAGETHRVELDVDAARPVAVTVTDPVSEGLEANARFETVADGRTLRYDVEFAQRGRRKIGPAEVVITDAFGLWERAFSYSGTARVTVYPPIHPLRGSAGDLSGYVGLTDEREQFEGLREYRRGDALRDVNWKASAKRVDELVVTEYAGEGAMNNVVVSAATTDGDRADAVAEAAASVVTFLLDAGIGVGLHTPGERIPPNVGTDHRRRVLTALAEFRGGRLGPGDEADIRIDAGPDEGVSIDVDGKRHQFDELVATRREAPAA